MEILNFSNIFQTLSEYLWPSDDTLAILRGLIFRIATIAHVYFAYGGKKDIKAELLKLNKSVNIVSNYFHANYKETEIFYLNIKTSVINEFNKKNSSGFIFIGKCGHFILFCLFFHSLSFFLKLGLLSLTKIYLSPFSPSLWK